jgi:arsenite methyltransferase
MSKMSDANNDVDAAVLREAVKEKYREVALSPDKEFHFHTGRALAKRLGYDMAIVDDLPDYAVESFAGVASPFKFREPQLGEKVVDVGSGAGFDSFVAARMVGEKGAVIGVDMTPEMLNKANRSAESLTMEQVEFREGLIENMPVEDDWADVVISNGVFNLCPDKKAAFSEVLRVLRPGGCLQFADIANGTPVPEAALKNIDLWTA